MFSFEVKHKKTKTVIASGSNFPNKDAAQKAAETYREHNAGSHDKKGVAAYDVEISGEEQ